MNKEIIIDGVNVAECMHFDKVSYSFGNTYYCMCDGNMSYICQENSNCYYKQLKRKEEECEAYKMEAEEGIEINAELKVALKEISFENQKFCYQIEEQTKQLDQLKADNLSLKRGIEIAKESDKYLASKLKTENDNYKKALQEIREIQKDCDGCNGDCCYCYSGSGWIFKLSDEVLKGNFEVLNERN